MTERNQGEARTPFEVKVGKFQAEYSSEGYSRNRLQRALGDALKEGSKSGLPKGEVDKIMAGLYQMAEQKARDNGESNDERAFGQRRLEFISPETPQKGKATPVSETPATTPSSRVETTTTPEPPSRGGLIGRFRRGSQKPAPASETVIPGDPTATPAGLPETAGPTSGLIVPGATEQIIVPGQSGELVLPGQGSAAASVEPTQGRGRRGRGRQEVAPAAVPNPGRVAPRRGVRAALGSPGSKF